MGRHSTILIVGQGQMFLGFDAVEHMTKTVESRFGPGPSILASTVNKVVRSTKVPTARRL